MSIYFSVENNCNKLSKVIHITMIRWFFLIYLKHKIVEAINNFSNFYSRTVTKDVKNIKGRVIRVQI